MPSRSPIEQWGPDRLADLAGLVDRALPDERLTPDELRACCWDEPGVVLGADGMGAVAAVCHSYGDWTVGGVKLVVVDESARRRGLGAALLAAAEAWAFERGATEVQLGGTAPFYLWPGVDTTMLAMLCLAEAAEYEPVGAELNLALPTTFRAPAPAGMAVRRVLDEADAASVQDLVDRHWPWWRAELDRAIEQATCHAAFVEGADHCAGFACHSVNRAAWVGPMGTDPARRVGGIGHALLAELCTDLMVAHFAQAEIAWVGPVRFYAKAGAGPSRTFRTYRKRKP